MDYFSGCSFDLEFDFVAIAEFDDFSGRLIVVELAADPVGLFFVSSTSQILCAITFVVLSVHNGLITSRSFVRKDLVAG